MYIRHPDSYPNRGTSFVALTPMDHYWEMGLADFDRIPAPWASDTSHGDCNEGVAGRVSVTKQ